jgi:hypothetical protein
LGEYYIVANPDKRQYLNSNSLGVSVKLPGVMAGPLPQILVWLLAEGAPITEGLGIAGTWAGDRIVVAGDEGPTSEVYQRAHAELRDGRPDRLGWLVAPDDHRGTRSFRRVFSEMGPSQMRPGRE